jgi:hypothetical protein
MLLFLEMVNFCAFVNITWYLSKLCVLLFKWSKKKKVQQDNMISVSTLNTTERNTIEDMSYANN